MTRNHPTEPPSASQSYHIHPQLISPPQHGEHHQTLPSIIPLSPSRTSYITSPATFPITSTSDDKPPIPPLQLLPMTYSDIPAIVDVHISAYQHDVLNQLGNQGFSDEARRKNMIERFRELWKKSSPAVWPIKAVRTSDGKVVGCAIWDVYDRRYKRTPEVVAQREVERQAVRDMVGLLRGGPVGCGVGGGAGKRSGDEDTGLQKEMAEAVHGLHLKWTNADTRFMYLASIAVDLSSQSLGVGRALLHQGMSVADSKGLAIWLEGTPAGHPIYEHYGWKTVDDRAIDLQKYGGKDKGYGVYKIFGCWRLPLLGTES